MIIICWKAITGLRKTVIIFPNHNFNHNKRKTLLFNIVAIHLNNKIIFIFHVSTFFIIGNSLTGNACFSFLFKDVVHVVCKILEIFQNLRHLILSYEKITHWENVKISCKINIQLNMKKKNTKITNKMCFIFYIKINK